MGTRVRGDYFFVRLIFAWSGFAFFSGFWRIPKTFLRDIFMFCYPQIQTTVNVLLNALISVFSVFTKNRCSFI